MKEIRLSGSQNIITADGSVAYQVAEGFVLIFLLPVCGDKPMRRLPIGRVGAGFVVPSLSGSFEYKGEACKGYFLLLPDDSAVVNVIPCTDAYRADFLRKKGVGNPGTDASAVDFANCMGKYYADVQAEEEQTILRRREKRRESNSRRFARGRESFIGDYERERKLKVNTDSPLYNAAAFLCNYRKTPITSIQNLRRSCGEDFSIQDIARLSGFVCREVALPEDWMRRDLEPMLCMLDGDKPIVCFSRRKGSIRYWNAAEDKFGILTEEMARRLQGNAYVLSRPLQGDKITIKEITRYALGEFSLHDVITMLLGMLLATVVSLQFSRLSEILYDVIIPQGSSHALFGYGYLMASYMLGGVCFSIAKGIAGFRLNSRIKYSLQAAIYDRLFHLPESFFRGREHADLAYRAGSLADSYVNFFNNVTQIVLMTLFSSLYLFRMYRYSGMLSNIGVGFIAVNMLLSVLVGYMMMRLQQKKARMTGGIRSFLFQVFSGINTVRSSGAEDSALDEYLKMYVNMGVLELKTGYRQQLSKAITSFVNAMAIISLYYAVSRIGTALSVGGFMGFTSAYSALSGSMMQVASCALSVFIMLPMMKNSMEILKVAPERADKGYVFREMQGDIRVAGVNFGYNPKELILRDINLHIHPGEYIAIVGTSGCGKSTLLRLLLGFEHPATGKVYFDGVELDRINKPELRRRMGVVLQDGVLFSGTIYRNIRIARPNATHEEVLAAVSAAGLDQDIARMPLGLQTLVSEQAQTISGGQKQRILLARAMIGNPRVLILDEATSALDNVTQSLVCDNLAQMGATRIVVAHRLSTVEKCDRILVMDQGRIVEEGNFHQLMERRGIFYNLARMQQL